MGDLSKHFSRKEFACECGCGFDDVDPELVDVLENDVHAHYREVAQDGPLKGKRVRVVITGPNRCPAHNSVIPGAVPGSSHTKGKAADFKVYIGNHQVPAWEVATLLENKYPDKYGIGRYSNRTHLDVRHTKHRWDYS